MLLLLMLSGCTSTVTTGEHVPVIARNSEQAATLATKVLAALPEDEIRKRVKERFPQVTAKDLQRIHINYRAMQFYESGSDQSSRNEVHLVSTIQYDHRLSSIADQMSEYIAAMLRTELARQQRNFKR